MAKGRDHDPPAKAKLVPYGLLMVATGAPMLVFGAHDTSDAWVDAPRMWWLSAGPGLGSIKRLVIDLDNGPKYSGRRTQFLKRMVEFVDWSGREVRLVYYPPYHSKYNPIERCRSAVRWRRSSSRPRKATASSGPRRRLTNTGSRIARRREVASR